MTTVVVSGSNNDFRFAVTDFSNAAAPSTTFVNPGFATTGGPTNNGCVVACSSLFTDGDISGSLVAVGYYGGGQVAIYDLSNPASPSLKASFSTGLNGIGALSLNGNNLLVGEANGEHIALLDISQPQSKAIVSNTPVGDFANGGVSSLAINGSFAVVSGAYAFDVLDYTTPTTPKVIPFIFTGNAAAFTPPFVCDYDGSTAALGDANGLVGVFYLGPGGATMIGQAASSGLQGITSITVQSGYAIQVVAANYGAPQVALLSFAAEGPLPGPAFNILTVNSNSQGDAGGAVAFYGLPNLIASTNNNQGITWFNTEIWPTPSVTGVAPKANLAPATISTLGMAYFPTPTPRWRLLPWWLLQLVQKYLP